MSLESNLAQLEAAQIIRRANEPDLAYIFKNALAQETAYTALLNRTRRDIHLCVARALEEMYAEHLDEYAALLAQHYAQAGDTAKTFAYSNRAGHAALRVYACAEAITHFTRAITAAQELDPQTLPGHDEQNALADCYLNRGRALELTGKFQEALANYEEMESLALARNDRPMQLAALVALATIHSTATAISDITHARALIDLALGLAREIGDRKTEAQVLWNLMNLHAYLGDMAASVQTGEQSLAISRELGMDEQTALTLNDLFRPYNSIEKYGLARQAAEEAGAYFQAVGNQPMLADNLIRAGNAEAVYGDYDRAMDMWERADKIGQAIGNQWGQSFSRIMAGNIHFFRGNIARAIETMRESIRLGQLAGFMMPMYYVRADLALVYGSVGAIEQGIALAEESARFVAERFPRGVARAFANLARLYLLQGDLARAESYLNQSQANRGDDFSQRAFDRFPLVQIELALQKQAWDDAIQLVDKFYAYLRKDGIQTFRSEALYLKAQALAARGEATPAHEELVQAQGFAEKIGSRWMLWQIYAALGETEKARAVVEFIAQNTPAELRPGFLSLPTVREVIAR